MADTTDTSDTTKQLAVELDKWLTERQAGAVFVLVLLADGYHIVRTYPTDLTTLERIEDALVDTLRVVTLARKEAVRHGVMDPVNPQPPNATFPDRA